MFEIELRKILNLEEKDKLALGQILMNDKYSKSKQLLQLRNQLNNIKVIRNLSAHTVEINQKDTEEIRDSIYNSNILKDIIKLKN